MYALGWFLGGGLFACLVVGEIETYGQHEKSHQESELNGFDFNHCHLFFSVEFINFITSDEPIIKSVILTKYCERSSHSDCYSAIQSCFSGQDETVNSALITGVPISFLSNGRPED